MYPPVDPIIFAIGPFALRWYGLLMMAAILAATQVASWAVARQGEDPDNLWDMLFWSLIPGFVGARLYYVFIQSPRGPEGLGYYLNNPGQILQVWGGGNPYLWGVSIWGGCPVVVYPDPPVGCSTVFGRDRPGLALGPGHWSLGQLH